MNPERAWKRHVCRRKIAYANARSAWRVCRQMWQELRERLYAYRCPCSRPGNPHYHVGHCRGR